MLRFVLVQNITEFVETHTGLRVVRNDRRNFEQNGSEGDNGHAYDREDSTRPPNKPYPRVRRQTQTVPCSLNYTELGYVTPVKNQASREIYLIFNCELCGETHAIYSITKGADSSYIVNFTTSLASSMIIIYVIRNILRRPLCVIYNAMRCKTMQCNAM